MKKLFITLVFLTLAAAPAASAQESPAADEAIRIGVHDILSGQNAFSGKLEAQGIRLANKADDQALGRPVELVILDNKGTPEGAARAVKSLIEDFKVVGILGTFSSSLAMAGDEVSGPAGIPSICPSCTNPLVSQGRRHAFTMAYIDPAQGSAAASYAYNTLGLKTAATLYDSKSDYSVGLASYFEAAFKRLGGTIVARRSYQTGDRDFSEQLGAIIAKKPDILFMPAFFDEGILIIQQARKSGGEFRIMGGDAMDNPLMSKIGQGAAEGFLQTTFAFHPDMENMSPAGLEFVRLWSAADHSALSREPLAPNPTAAMGYDSYRLMVDAIRRAGSADPKAISAALSDTKDFQAVTGSLTIDPEGSSITPVGLVEIKDGQKIFVGIVSAR